MKKPKPEEIELFAPALKSSLDDMPRIERPAKSSREANPSAPVTDTVERERVKKKREGEKLRSKVRRRDTVVSRYQSKPASLPEGAPIEVVYQVVQEFGKEAATRRITVAEKRAVAEIVYAYGQRGIQTTENEIMRIGLNWLIHDYRVNGENSVLAKVINKLNPEP